MKLKDWLDEHRLTAHWCAQQIGVADSMMSKWINGKRAPSLQYINKIHRLTGGDVTSLDWGEDSDQEDARRAA